MTKNLLKTFPAFNHKYYRWYFTGQLISMIGVWLQTVAQGWLVLQITHSAFAVGFISGLSFMPILLFSLFGGVLIDRFHKRNLIIFTQAIQMVLAFILGALAYFNLVNIYDVGLLAFLLGLINAIDQPARQAFTTELVCRKEIPSAITLNNGVYNTASVIGPALAGALIALFGNAGAFILNGLSFIAPIFALYLMNIKSEIPENQPNTLKSIKAGLTYVKDHSLIKTLLIFASATAIFGWSYTTIMPVIAQNVFHKDSYGLGILYASVGLGSVIGAIFVSAFSQKFSVKNMLLSACLIFATSLFLFSTTNNFVLALIFLFPSGIGLAMLVSLLNATIQRNVDQNLRGRVMSMWSVCFVGMFPLGSFQIGFLSDHLGVQTAIRLGAIILFVFGIFLYYSLNKIQRLESQP